MARGDANKITVTTASDGSDTAYLPGATGSYTGPLLSVSYEKTDYADTVDFTITTEATGQTAAENVWVEANVTASKTVYPSAPVHDQVGVVTGAADYIQLVNQRIKIVIANGGSVKTGTFSCKVG